MRYFQGDIVETRDGERVTVESVNADHSLNVRPLYTPAIVRLPVRDSVDARLVRGAP